MCWYLSTTENECSYAVTEAVKEAFKAYCTSYECICLIAQAYFLKR